MHGNKVCNISRDVFSVIFSICIDPCKEKRIRKENIIETGAVSVKCNASNIYKAYVSKDIIYIQS